MRFSTRETCRRICNNSCFRSTWSAGDEPLLVQECCDQIRRHAREQGCTEREVIEAGGAHFNWQEILHSAGQHVPVCRAQAD